MRKFYMTIVLLTVLLAVNFPLQGQTSKKIVTNFLNSKKYEGDTKKYVEADLSLPGDLDKAANRMGVSIYSLLRNEIYARHGYTFKNEILNDLFGSTDWYKANPNFNFAELNEIEEKNSDYLKSIENNYDYEVVSKWLNDKGYFADLELYDNPGYYEMSAKVQFALNHLKINAANILRNEVFARHGYIFSTSRLSKVFKKTTWYKPTIGDIKVLAKDFTKIERINVELLREREWVDILNAVNFSLPQNVQAIPVIGYNAMFIRTLNYKGTQQFYSSNFMTPVARMDEKILDGHSTNTDTLVTPEIIEKIKNEQSPQKKLSLFFENKQYQGYANRTVFNLSDMQIPSYLKDAVEAYGVDYKILLRKEIHARNGAKFIDRKSGSIFKACSWYKAKHELSTETISRFPNNVKVSDTELINFALIEGQYLHEIYEKYKALGLVLDLSGNLYFVKTENVNVSANKEPVMLGHGFKTENEYTNTSLEDVIKAIKEKFNFNAEEYERNEENYNGDGC